MANKPKREIRAASEIQSAQSLARRFAACYCPYDGGRLVDFSLHPLFKANP